MNLQTQIPLVKKSGNLIDYHSSILLLGSCFSENIGNKFEYFKFQTLQNPFGILFNPKAIETIVSNAKNGKKYDDADVFRNNEQWQCFDAHSKLSATSRDDILLNLNTATTVTAKKIQEATHIIITLGTAWVYRHKELNKIVVNCHKVPQTEFIKELMSIQDIQKALSKVIQPIRSVNSNCTIIFTVSPIRHIKDGFVENTRSKAHLISAIHTLMSAQGESNAICYFPSYEIMMDELRDYRFYSEDMIHPNKIGINYIWQKFVETWISKEAIAIMDEVDSIQKGLSHNSFNPKSNAHQKFLENLDRKKQRLQQEFPSILF